MLSHYLFICRYKPNYEYAFELNTKYLCYKKHVSNFWKCISIAIGDIIHYSIALAIVKYIMVWHYHIMAPMQDHDLSV